MEGNTSNPTQSKVKLLFILLYMDYLKDYTKEVEIAMRKEESILNKKRRKKRITNKKRNIKKRRDIKAQGIKSIENGKYFKVCKSGLSLKKLFYSS